MPTMQLAITFPVLVLVRQDGTELSAQGHVLMDFGALNVDISVLVELVLLVAPSQVLAFVPLASMENTARKLVH